MTLANRITIIRILLIPVFIAAMYWASPYAPYAAAALFTLLALTDKLDGHIARKRNEITDLGKLMDPLADKLLVCAALLILLEQGRIEAVSVFLIIAREFMVSGLRQIAAARGVVIAAGQWGKWKTVSQIVAIIALILENAVRISVPVGMILYYIAVALTVLSGIQYLYRYRKILREDTEDTI